MRWGAARAGALPIHSCGPKVTLNTLAALFLCLRLCMPVPVRLSLSLSLSLSVCRYVMPICDWRLACLGSEEDCLADYNAGAMTYPDSMSGMPPTVSTHTHTQRGSRGAWCLYSNMGRRH
jgi:hypothetical protein